MKKIIAVIAYCVMTINVFGASLQIDSPEVKQLLAMGYEPQYSKGNTETTLMTNGSTNIILSTNGERLVIFRIFKRRQNLTQAQEYDLLRLINEANINTSYQVALGVNYFTIALYSFGQYDSKIFSRLVRNIEKADTVFESNQKFLDLIN